MSSRYIDPFDFAKLKNYFIGNDTIFAFAFVIIYSYAAAYFGFSDKLYYFILVIGVILFGLFMGESIYILALLLVAGFVFKVAAKYLT